MLSENFLSALQILIISYNSSFGIGAETSAQACVVVYVPEHVERDTSLSFIIRFLHIPFLEEHFEFFLRDLKDRFVLNCVALIAAQQWL